MEHFSAKKRAYFETLVIEHHVQLRAFVRSLGVDPDWVDDIAQEAFLIAYRSWTSFDQKQDFGKWIRGIAANLVRNELRKDARQRRILHTELAEVLLHRVAEMEDRPEPMTISAIKECLDELAPLSLALVQARYRDGESAPELARRFDRSAANIRQMLLRVRQQIRQCVELRLLRGM